MTQGSLLFKLERIPWRRFFRYRRAGRGAGCGPGGPPHFLLLLSAYLLAAGVFPARAQVSVGTFNATLREIRINAGTVGNGKSNGAGMLGNGPGETCTGPNAAGNNADITTPPFSPLALPGQGITAADMKIVCTWSSTFTETSSINGLNLNLSNNVTGQVIQTQDDPSVGTEFRLTNPFQVTGNLTYTLAGTGTIDIGAGGSVPGAGATTVGVISNVAYGGATPPPACDQTPTFLESASPGNLAINCPSTLTVLTLGGPGANGHYTVEVDNYVEIDGGYTTVDLGVVIFYDLAPAAPQAGPDVAITDVQLVQVVHNWPPVAYVGAAGTDYKAFDLPLIVNKRTIARVFIKSIGNAAAPVPGVTAVLHGPFDPDPYMPFSGPITAQVYDGPLPLTSPPDFNEQTIDFDLPMSWLQESGGYSLQAEIVMPAGVVDSDQSNNKFNTTFALQNQPESTQHATDAPGNVLQVGYISVCTPVAGAPNSCPGGGPLQAAYGFNLTRWYPVRRDGVEFFRASGAVFTLPMRPLNNGQYDLLLAPFMMPLYARFNPGLEFTDFLVGFTTDTIGGLEGGISDGIWRGGHGRVAFIMDYAPGPPAPANTIVTNGLSNAPTFSAYNVAHEIGHLMGLEHAIGVDGVGCRGNVANVACTNWPYYLPNQTANPRNPVPVWLAPLLAGGYQAGDYRIGYSPSIQFPGYDAVSHQLRPALSNPAPPLPDGLVQASLNYDMMSYCVNQAAAPPPAFTPVNASQIWISPFSYQWLFDHNLAPSDRTILSWAYGPGDPSTHPPTVCPPPTNFAPDSVLHSPVSTSQSSLGSAPASARPQTRQILPRASSAQDLVMITGSAQADGSSGTLDPLFHLSTTTQPDQSDATGNYCLRFFNSGVNLQQDFCFTMSFLDAEMLQPMTSASFYALIALPAGANSMSLLLNGSAIASATAGSRPPALTITSPKAGATWQSGQQTIAWTGTSSGTGPLTYIVDYSSDGGLTWSPVTTPATDSQYTLDSSALNGGSNVYFRVQASDGVSTTTAIVGPITVAQAPHAAASPTSVNFMNGLVAQSVDQQVTISNNGSGPLQVTAVQINSQAFQLVTPRVPFTVFAGDSVILTLSFSAPAVGTAQGTMTITSNATDNPTLIVPLQGNGIGATASYAAVTPTTLNFGNVTVGANGTQTATVESFGPAPLNVSAVSVSGAAFHLTAPQAAFTLPVNSTQAIEVEFSPAGNGPQTGTLTIASDDPAHATLTVPLTGTGVGGGPGGIVLEVDGGTFTQAVGYPDGGENGVYFVNRLTPPSYPATLASVQIYFGNRTDGLTQGAAITVVAGASVSGSSTIDGVTLAKTAATVNTLGAFNSYAVAPVTITSGDFVVGFVVNNANGILPADEDITSGSQQRSYTSTTGGASFVLLDSVPGLGGNLGIRATLTAGSGQ